jgi:DNA invertase Pin-like site-specific DNA recombinase
MIHPHAILGENMKQVVAYARISTDDQCLSVAGQFAAIQIAAETHSWQIVGQFTDEGVSGSIDPQDRAQCRLALAMAKGLDCPVVVHRVDRLTRDHAHFVNLQKKYTVVEAEDVHGSGLVRNIKSLLAEEELIKIRKRTKDGLAELKVQAQEDTPKGEEARQKIARRDAGRAKAWAVGNGAALKAKRQNANARADAVAHHIKACLYDGCGSFAIIAECLNSKRVTTSKGKAFQPMTVLRLMNRLGLSLNAKA